jgi:hypothetical protein
MTSSGSETAWDPVVYVYRSKDEIKSAPKFDGHAYRDRAYRDPWASTTASSVTSRALVAPLLGRRHR